MRRILFMLAAASVLLFSARLFAQEGEEARQVELDDIIVSATRTEKSVKDAPGAVTVIGKEEIAANPATSIDGLLNSAVPGFYMIGGNNDFNVNSPPQTILRGISGRMQILMDGIPLNDPRTSNPFLFGVAPASLERVEAVKGPMSALYGSSMAGIVNLVSVMPQKSEINTNLSYGNPFIAGKGNKNALDAFISYGNKAFDSLSFYVSCFLRQTDGFPSDPMQGTTYGLTGIPTTTPVGVENFIYGDRGAKVFSDKAFTFKAQYELNPYTFFNAAFYRQERYYEYSVPHNLDGNPVNAKTDEYQNSFSFYGPTFTNRDIYSVSAESKFFNLLYAKLSASYIDHYYWYTSADTSALFSSGTGYSTITPSKTYIADLQFSLPVFGQNLTFGASYKQDETEQKQYSLSYWKNLDSVTGLRGTDTSPGTLQGGKSTLWGAYLQDEISVLKNLTVYAGVRLDWWISSDGWTQVVRSGNALSAIKNYDDRTELAFSPKLAVVYNPLEITTVRVSGGRAFNAPNLYQMYGTWTATTGISYASNPDLKPETVWSWDASVTQDLWKGAQATLGYFENYMFDLISSSTYTQDGVTYPRKNIGEATARGIEAGFEQALFELLKIKLDYTWTRSVVTKDDSAPNSVGKFLRYVPQHQLSFGIEGHYKKAKAYLGGRYTGKRYATDDNSDIYDGVRASYDPFFIVNAKLSYDFTRSFSAAAVFNNILNYEYYDYYLAPGASWALSVSYKY